MAPVTGTVSFRGTADDLLRFTVDGVTIIDTVSSEGGASTSVLTGNVEMEEVRFANIICLFVKSEKRWGYERTSRAECSWKWIDLVMATHPVLGETGALSSMLPGIMTTRTFSRCGV